MQITIKQLETDDVSDKYGSYVCYGVMKMPTIIFNAIIIFIC